MIERLAEQAPAAWYPDPAGSGGLRWWDGTQWTAHVSAPQAAPVANASPTGAPAGRTTPWWSFALAATIAVLVIVAIAVAVRSVYGSARDRVFDRSAQAAAHQGFDAGRSLYAEIGSYGLVTPGELERDAPGVRFTNGLSYEPSTASVFATDQSFAVAVRSPSGRCWVIREDRQRGPDSTSGRLRRGLPCSAALATVALVPEGF